MNCENNLCIYESKGKCILDSIEIDSSGMCTERIYPDVNEEILTQTRMKLLKIYEETDND